MSEINENKKYALALGYFDGLHKAHMAVLETAAGLADEGFVPAVMLFDEHPKRVLCGKDVPALLLKSRRDGIIDAMGIERISVSFAEIKDMSPREFVEKLVVEKACAGAVVCGYNYRFGKNASGDVDELKRLCRELGVKVVECEKYLSDGEEVSSTAIRQAVSQGNMEKANRMLGFPYGFSAEVVTGDRRGRLLGTPTINQYIPEGLAVPLFGVYASKVFIGSEEYVGVTNIGNRPTFDGTNVRSETYIVDYSGDLYGETIGIQLFSFIREERKFADADALKQQIALDVTAAKAFFYKN